MQEKQQLTPAEAVRAIKQAHKLIIGAAASRHAAFSSPSPSSTESRIRKNVKQAEGLLDITLALMRA